MCRNRAINHFTLTHSSPLYCELKFAMAANFENLVSRLESAVARLEKLGLPASGLSSVLSGPLSTSTTPLAATLASTTASGSSSASVAAFESVLSDGVANFLKISDSIGNESVSAASKLVAKAFEEEKKIVTAISQCKVRRNVFGCHPVEATRMIEKNHADRRCRFHSFLKNPTPWQSIRHAQGQCHMPTTVKARDCLKPTPEAISAFFPPSRSPKQPHCNVCFSLWAR